MNKENNIYSVPEGYFDSLRARLEAIPSQQGTVAPAPVFRMPFYARVKPYLAFAACFVAAFLIGTFILGRMTPVQDGIAVEDYYYADLIPVTDPYAAYGSAPSTYEVDESSEDDIVEYLISSGASIDYIAYLFNE